MGRQVCYIYLMEEAQKDTAKYVTSETLRIASKFCKQEIAWQILVKGLDICPYNYLLWRDLARQHRNANTDVSKEVWLDEYLNLMHEVYSEAKLVSRNKPVTVTSCHERGKNLVDTTGSEWWTEEETACIVIDLELECDVSSLEIQWWGSSVSKDFCILAAEEDSFEHVKHSSDAYENPSGLNSLTRFTGWNIKTRKVKIELKEGTLDPWGMRKYFGIRQVNIYGNRVRESTLLYTEKYRSDEPIIKENSPKEIDLGLRSFVDYIKIRSAENIKNFAVKIYSSIDGLKWEDIKIEPVNIDGQSLEIHLSRFVRFIRIQWEKTLLDPEEIFVYGKKYSLEDILTAVAKKKLIDHPHVEKHVSEMLTHFDQ